MRTGHKSQFREAIGICQFLYESWKVTMLSFVLSEEGIRRIFIQQTP